MTITRQRHFWIYVLTMFICSVSSTLAQTGSITVRPLNGAANCTGPSNEFELVAGGYCPSSSVSSQPGIKVRWTIGGSFVRTWESTDRTRIKGYFPSAGTWPIRMYYQPTTNFSNCLAETSTSVSVTIGDSSPYAGTIDDVTICSGDLTTLTVTGNAASINTWQQKLGGAWEDISGTFGLRTLPSNKINRYSTREYRVRVRNACGFGHTSPATVTVKSVLATPNITDRSIVCSTIPPTIIESAEGNIPEGKQVYHTIYFSNGNSSTLEAAKVTHPGQSTSVYQSTWSTLTFGNYEVDVYINDPSFCRSPKKSFSIIDDRPVIPSSLDVKLSSNFQTVSSIDICEGDRVSVFVSGVSNVVWREPSTLVTVGTSSALSFIPSAAGQYSVAGDYVDQCGQVRRIYGTLNVNFPEIDTPDFGQVDQLCDRVVLHKEVENPNVYWQLNPVAPSFDNNGDSFEVTVDQDGDGDGRMWVYLMTRQGGCWGPAAPREITFEKKSQDFDIAGKTRLCQDESTSLYITGGGSNEYIWKDIDNGNVLSIDKGLGLGNISQPFNMTVTGIAPNLCVTTKTIRIQILAPENHQPSAPHMTKTEDGIFVLHKGDQDTDFEYFWKTSPEGKDAVIGGEQFFRTPQNHGVYYLRPRNEEGCWGKSTAIEVPNIIENTEVNNFTVTDANYVKTFSYQYRGLEGDPETMSSDLVETDTDYIDGIGRLIQSVTKQGTPDKRDVIAPVEYDALGRVKRDFLPFSYGINSGGPAFQPYKQVFDFYERDDAVANTTVPFTYRQFDNSPLNRVIAEAAPGEAWAACIGTVDGKYVKYDYLVNDATQNVIKWQIDANGLPFHQNSELGRYSQGELQVVQNTDENGNVSQEMTDRNGNLILKRSLDDGGEWLETYYVYDHFENLRFVLPPMAIRRIGQETNDWLDHWAFQYQYDELQRLTAKKIPGSSWIYYVYDERDRVILTQDGNQRLRNQWVFTKYDALNRVVLTGVHDTTATLTQAQMQQVVEHHESLSPLNLNEAYGGNVHGYTNRTYPIVQDESAYLHVNYYDNYKFLNDPTWAGYRFEQPSSENTDLFANVQGQITGSKTRLLSGNTFLKKANYYNDRYDLIQSITEGYGQVLTRLDQSYDFNGRLIHSTKTYIERGKGYEVVWQDVNGLELDGSNVTKTEVDGWGNSGATSYAVLEAGADGWASFEVAENDKALFFGLASANLDDDPLSIDHAFDLKDDGKLHVYDRTNAVKDFDVGTYEVGDVLKVERIDGIIYYYRNDNIIHSST
ncbi:MAG: DUF6443 domain-containing protein, partial [Bacteroidota bacterium]